VQLRGRRSATSTAGASVGSWTRSVTSGRSADLLTCGRRP